MTDTVVAPPTDFARELRREALAMRLGFRWLGVRRALSHDQKAQAAESFAAESEYLSAGKKLLDTRHPAVRRVWTVRTRAAQMFRGYSLPYPEPGIRLLRQRDVQPMVGRLETLRCELHEAARELDESFDDLKQQARERLGELFEDSDYPASLRDAFEIIWDFPSVEPPDFLQQLAPELYEHESQRVRARFEQAVALAEQSFMDEFAKLVEHLTERLSGETDGRPKIFRDSAVENLGEFFERFRSLSIRSNPELDELVTRAQGILSGVGPDRLRQSDPLRSQVAMRLLGVQSRLDGMMVNRPRRQILRGSSRPQEA
ncbi:MAG: hypothetical protein KC561_13120 [Myxococcales bacterium]|nr:hypothetical protein [Myxococcales bacterium]